MKKMININFQGRVIPIEETSFDILKHYIESLRVYFAKEEGRDEIINDIESRIAELFSERLKNTPCITDEDVNSIISSMGRPEDFEEAEVTGNYNMDTESSAASYTNQPETSEPKIWRRALNEKFLGGVCGGIAHYLKIDPAIVRILFAILAIGSFGFWVLVYVLIWIILPAQVMTPNARKRFYRSTDHRVLGGVAGGLAAYFGTDVWIPRFVFAVPVLLTILAGITDLDFFQAFFGGLIATCVIVYIILWIILPEARTASAKLEMRGEEVNLQSIKNTVNEDPGVVIQPRSGKFGNAIVIIFKAFFLFIAGLASLGFITAFVALLFGGIVGGNGIYPVKDFIIETRWQNFLLWCSLILFLAVPAIALLTWFIRRIMGKRSKRHYLAYVFGALWLLGIVSIVTLTALVIENFRTREDTEETVPVYYPVNGKLYVKVKDDVSTYDNYRKRSRRGLPVFGKNGDSLFLKSVRIDILRSNDSSYHVHKLTYATGSDSEKAIDRASRVVYSISQNDSSLIIPRGFMIDKNAGFRNQQVLLVIEVPVGRKIEIDRSATSFFWFNINPGFHDNDWDDDWKGVFHWKSNTEYIMTQEGPKKVPKEKEAEESGREKRKKTTIKTGNDSVSLTL